MNPQLYENYPRFIHTLCRGSYSSPQGQLPGKYQTEIFIFFIFPPFHLGSCLGNFRGQSGYFLFHIFTPFFLLLICGHEILLNYFLSPFFLLLRLWMDREIFFPVCTERLRNIMNFFVVSELFFSSYVSGWTEKEKIFPQSLHGVCEKNYENIFCLRIFFNPPTSLDEQKKRKYFQSFCTEFMGI